MQHFYRATYFIWMLTYAYIPNKGKKVSETGHLTSTNSYVGLDICAATPCILVK